MNGIMFLRLGECHLICIPVEVVVPVLQTIRPGNKWGTVGTVANGVNLVRVQDVSITDLVESDSTSYLDDNGSLVFPADLDLLARWTRIQCRSLLPLPDIVKGNHSKLATPKSGEQRCRRAGL